MLFASLLSILAHDQVRPQSLAFDLRDGRILLALLHSLHPLECPHPGAAAAAARSSKHLSRSTSSNRSSNHHDHHPSQRASSSSSSSVSVARSESTASSSSYFLHETLLHTPPDSPGSDQRRSFSTGNTTTTTTTAAAAAAGNIIHSGYSESYVSSNNSTSSNSLNLPASLYEKDWVKNWREAVSSANHVFGVPRLLDTSAPLFWAHEVNVVCWCAELMHRASRAQHVTPLSEMTQPSATSSPSSSSMPAPLLLPPRAGDDKSVGGGGGETGNETQQQKQLQPSSSSPVVMTYRSSTERAVEQLEQEVEQLRSAVEEQAIDLTDATQRLEAKIEETENLRAEQVFVMISVRFCFGLVCVVLFCLFHIRFLLSATHSLDHERTCVRAPRLCACVLFVNNFFGLAMAPLIRWSGKRSKRRGWSGSARFRSTEPQKALPAPRLPIRLLRRLAAAAARVVETTEAATV